MKQIFKKMNLIKTISLICLFPVFLQSQERRTFTEESEVDSLLLVISRSADYEEVLLRSWYVDSLETNLDLTPQQKGRLNGKNRNWRASFIDSIRMSHGHSSRFSTFLDSSWQRPTAQLYISDDDLSFVVETYVRYKANEDLSSIWKGKGNTFTGEKFPSLQSMEIFLSNLESKYFKWFKTHGTRYFIDADDGNDVDDGLSEGNAWLTMGAANGVVAGGDTIIVEGTFVGEFFEPSDDGTGFGTGRIVFIDSTSFTDGVNLTDAYSVNDTTQVWRMDGNNTVAGAVEIRSDNYYSFIGLYGFNSTERGIRIRSSSIGTMVLKCKFESPNTNSATRYLVTVEGNAAADSIISCLIIDDAGSPQGSGLYYQSTSTGDDCAFLNNTIYGAYDNASVHVDDGTINGLVLKNNIIYATGSHVAIKVDTVGAVIADWDNNIIFRDNAGDEFTFNGASFDDISVWEDSVNNYDGDGAANSLKTDPSLQNVATSLSILNTSAAFNAAENNDFNHSSTPSIGYFQLDAAAAVGRRRSTLF